MSNIPNYPLFYNGPVGYKEKDSDAVMLAKAIGLKGDDGKPIYDITVAPYADAQSKSKWKPSREVLNAEVLRRYNSVEAKPSMTVPGKDWTSKSSIYWLEENPLTTKTEVAETRAEVATFKALLISRATSAATIQGQWKNEFVYLRCIHCFIEDENIRAAYVRSFDALNKDQLDAQRSDEPKEDVFEMIAEKMNDPFFCPFSKAYSNLHPDFVIRKSLAHHKMAVGIPITSLKVQQKMNEMRVQLTRIITNWTQSGQGCGGKEHEGAESNGFGAVAEIQRGANDIRSSFLGNDKPHILYLWETSLETKFLATVVQRIDPAVAAASAQDFVSVYPAGKKKKRAVTPTNDEDDGDDCIQMKVLKTMKKSSIVYERTHIRDNILNIEDKIFQLLLDLDRTESNRGKALITARIDQLNQNLIDLKKESEGGKNETNDD